MPRIHKFRRMLKGLENWKFYSDMIRYYRFLKNQPLFFNFNQIPVSGIEIVERQVLFGILPMSMLPMEVT